MLNHSNLTVTLNPLVNPSDMVTTKDTSNNEILHPEAIRRVQGCMLPENEYADIAALFKNFGDTTRVRILQYLQSGELCVSDMAALLGITKSAVSHQMQALKASKLVRARRDGQIVYYSLDDAHVGLILDLALAHIRE